MSWREPQGVLAELVAAAREDCEARRRRRPGLASEVERDRLRRPRGFVRALGEGRPGFPLICEVKRASPSAGAIRVGADACAQAALYASAGARCVSVLTEGRRFGGSLEDLRAVRQAVDVPLLRKDFLVDPYMVYEAAEAGADAVLLLVGALAPARLEELWACARELELDALVEVVHEREIEAMERLRPTLVGVNARDLETLQVDAGRFARMAPRLAEAGRRLVAESGMATPAHIAAAARVGAGAALVGEALMRSADPAGLVRAMVEAAG